jgi:hypothetical protein
MSTQEIKNNSGHLLGRIKKEGSKLVIYNKNGHKLGSYDGKYTVNKKGHRVGTGNFLITLL